MFPSGAAMRGDTARGSGQRRSRGSYKGLISAGNSSYKKW